MLAVVTLEFVTKYANLTPTDDQCRALFLILILLGPGLALFAVMGFRDWVRYLKKL